MTLKLQDIEIIAIALYESWVRFAQNTQQPHWMLLSVAQRDHWRREAKKLDSEMEMEDYRYNNTKLA